MTHALGNMDVYQLCMSPEHKGPAEGLACGIHSLLAPHHQAEPRAPQVSVAGKDVVCGGRAAVQTPVIPERGHAFHSRPQTTSNTLLAPAEIEHLTVEH